MKSIKLAAMCICAVLSVVSQGYGKDWRGITPLHSTCEDVKRQLNVASCESSIFNLEDEIANIDFSGKPCADGWNVPSGTVISITVYPKRKPQLTDLSINIAEYEKVVPQHQPDLSIYLNAEIGLGIAVTHDGRVDHFTYGPSAKDEYLRYPGSLSDQQSTGGGPHGVVKFDEYGDTTLGEGRKRLDNFARHLQAEPDMQGYIIAYAGRRARTGEAQARAGQAKAYLVNVRGIEGARIVTVDGGYREAVTVELFIGAKGTSVPSPSPTVCPSEVQVIRTDSGGSRGRHWVRLRHSKLDSQ